MVHFLKIIYAAPTVILFDAIDSVNYGRDSATWMPTIAHCCGSHKRPRWICQCVHWPTRLSSSPCIWPEWTSNIVINCLGVWNFIPTDKHTGSFKKACHNFCTCEVAYIKSNNKAWWQGQLVQREMKDFLHQEDHQCPMVMKNKHCKKGY